PERAAVKEARAFRGDGFERTRQRWLAQHLAEPDTLRAAHIERGPFRQKVRARAGELGPDLVDRRHIVFGEREAVARELDRGRKHLGERLSPMGAHEFAPAGEVAGRAASLRPARELRTLLEL